MSFVEVDWSPSDRKLRQFSALWMLLFGALGARAALHGGGTSLAVFGALSALGAGGVLWPKLIRPVYKASMVVTLPIGWASSHVLMASLFYLVVAPIGAVLRVFGYDPMARRFDRSKKSYWVPRDRSSELSRYFKQF